MTNDTLGKKILSVQLPTSWHFQTLACELQFMWISSTISDIFNPLHSFFKPGMVVQAFNASRGRQISEFPGSQDFILRPQVKQTD